LGRRQVAEATRSRLAHDPQAVEFLNCALETIDAVLELAAAYAPKPAAREAQIWRRSWSASRRCRRAPP